MTLAPSSKLLIGLVALFLLAFWFQRGRSEFLGIEAESDLARRVAVSAGVEVAEVMALRELLGMDLSWDRLLATARRYRALDAELGVALAAMVVAGHEQIVRSTLAEVAGDPAAAWRRLASRPEAIAAVRFSAMVKRFAARAAAREN